MDILPSNLINNIVIRKNFSADQPADFTGGLVNIETTDFPEERVFNVSAGISFNPSMHFNDEFLSYEGGNTDWLGFDDGTRELPSAAKNPTASFPSPGNVSDEEVNQFSREFSPTLAAQPATLATSIRQSTKAPTSPA